MIYLIYSDQFLEHDTGRPHPESFRRLVSITKALKEVVWADQLQWHEPSSVEERDPFPWILKLHSPEYLEKMKALAYSGGGHWDGDTPISSRSYDVAVLAVNACLDGIDKILATGQPAFALVRPPGHHAVSNDAM